MAFLSPRPVVRALRALSVVALGVPPFAAADGGAGAVTAAASTPATPGRGAFCDTAPINPEAMGIACALPPVGTTRVRLIAEFVGSHDDTKLSLVVTLDGKPIDCLPGSKTSLFAEDGTVALWCIADVGGARPVVAATATIHHAVWAGARLEPL